MDKKFKVFVTNRGLHEPGLNLLRETCDLEVHDSAETISREDLLGKVKGKDGIVCTAKDQIDSEILDAAGPNLKVISLVSAGYDNLPLPELTARGIKVGNTPFISEAVAEFTVGLVLATARRFIEANQTVYDGGWKKSWDLSWMCGSTLSQSTVGIFGLGNIGQGVVKRLKAFNVSTFLYSGRGPKKEGDTLGAEFVSFDELLGRSDFLICCSALTETTKLIFNISAFDKMKKSAIFINTARGGLVNHDALTEALKVGSIAAAGLDVMTPEPLPKNHPLLSAHNLTLLPHIGSAEITTRRLMSTFSAQNLLAGLEGRQMPYPLIS